MGVVKESPSRGAEMELAGCTLKKTSWLLRLTASLDQIALRMRTPDANNAFRPPCLHPVGQGMLFGRECFR
jgi:hypothetical protein